MKRATGLIGAAFGVVCSLWAVVAGAQVSISTLSEAQLGNIPGDKPADLRTAYVQLNLDLTYGALQAGVRNESHRTSETGRNYNELVQRFVRYHRGPIELSVGSYYSIIGQGLLLHAFEQPGVITEERSARRRYQLARDLDGVQLRYHNRIVDLVLLRGSPLNSDFPPGLSGIDRRQGTVRGGRIELNPRRFSIWARDCWRLSRVARSRMQEPCSPEFGWAAFWSASVCATATPRSTASTPSTIWTWLAGSPSIVTYPGRSTPPSRWAVEVSA